MSRRTRRTSGAADLRTALSVVVPSHNTRALTLACLASLRAAGLEHMEVVLVDDASRDGSAAAVGAAFPEVRLVRLEEPCGFTRAANRGLAEARGDVLLLLNSDTEVDRAGLLALLDRFAASPATGVIGGALHYPGGAPQWSGGTEPDLLWLFALASGLPALLAKLPGYRAWRAWRRSRPSMRGAVAWVTGAAMAIRRAAWEAGGPLDTRFRFYAQDLDLCLRLRRLGWEVEILPAFRVLHHHGASISPAPPREGTVGSGAPLDGAIHLGAPLDGAIHLGAPLDGALGSGAPQASGAVGAARQNPELLWTDLLRWADQERGPGWARRARRALVGGARLRLLGRALAAPAAFLLAPRGRAVRRADSAAYRRALAAVRAGV